MLEFFPSNQRSCWTNHCTIYQEFLRVQKIPVKNIYCDNAGENFSIQKMCEKEEYGNNFEFTGPGSPQYDGKVERKFSTMYGKVRAFLNNAKLPTNFRKGLWAEAMLPTWKMF